MFFIFRVGLFLEEGVSHIEWTNMIMEQAVIMIQRTAKSRVYVKVNTISLSSLKMGLVH